MTPQTPFIASLPLIFLSCISHHSAQPLPATDQQPPIARKIPRTTKIHGETLVDHYYWFREKTNPQLLAYLDAEEAYTNAMMKPTEALQERLYSEMVARISETDVSVPYRKGEFYYYSRYEPGKQYAIYARRKGSADGPEEVLLDLNTLAAGQSYMAISDFEVSDDGNFLAYSTDNTGYRRYILQIKDLRTGQLLPDRVERTTSVVWASDNRTIFYTTEDDAKRPYRLFRHRLGDSQDPMLFEERDELFRIYLWRSRSGEYIFLSTGSKIADEVHYLRAWDVDGTFRVISARRDGHEYSVDHQGHRFYIVTNDKGSNFRLVSTPAADPVEANWVEILRHDSERRIVKTEAFANHLVVNEREEGFTQFRVIDLRSGEQHRISLPETVYALSMGDNQGSIQMSFGSSTSRL